MSKIVIGKSRARNVSIDVDALLRTRMLVQANSGKGKSWLLRRLAEQLFGKVQVLIVDPEGEFATLREKYGYVLVGKGGETPADPRSAALVAHKLLELRASAVCDLYEMKPSMRHEWLEKFLDALIDSPKKLWHPCVVIVDEAHVFCPEKGSGESLASDAMIGLGTRGRKRGFAIVAATQRLGKLRKDLAAELLNVMIGGTFIDIDRKRAADALGVYGADQRKFFDAIKILERGSFYALGPAISNERILVKIGPVETTHPEAGSSKHAADAPPAPDKVKAMLTKLADLPKTAEEKARTEGELRKEIRELKAQLRSVPAPKPPGEIAESKASRRVMELVLEALKEAMKILVKVQLLNFEGTQFSEEEIRKALDVTVRDIRRLAQQKIASKSAELDRVKSDCQRALKRIEQLIYKERISVEVAVSKASGGEIQKEERENRPVAREARPAHTPRPIQSREPAQLNGDGELTPYMKEILNALADLEVIGRSEPPWPLVAAVAGKSSGSSTFERYAAKLRSMGLLEYPRSGQMRLTDEGRKHASASSDSLSSEEIQERALKIIRPYQAELLRALIAAYPREISWQDLGDATQKAPTSSTFERYMAALRSMEMIDYPRAKTAKASDWLFVD